MIAFILITVFIALSGLLASMIAILQMREYEEDTKEK